MKRAPAESRKSPPSKRKRSSKPCHPTLDPETYHDARTVAPGYDVYYLEQEWRNFWVESGKPELKKSRRRLHRILQEPSQEKTHDMNHGGRAGGWPCRNAPTVTWRFPFASGQGRAGRQRKTGLWRVRE